MANKKTALKKKIGRPLTVNSAAMVSVRVTADMDAALERWTKSARLTRPDAVRRLLELGLKSKPGS